MGSSLPLGGPEVGWVALPTGTVGFVCAEPEVAVPFADLLHEGAPTEPTVLDVVVERVASGDLALHIDGEPLLVSGRVADVVDGIVGVLNRAVLDHGPDSLHLHGAVVDLDGVGHLLAGPSGSGKTTLAAALLELGARYLTDEICTVDPTAISIPAYPKPLTLKPGWSPTADPVERSDAGRGALAASRLAPVTASTVVGGIWWVTYRPGGGRSSVTELSRVTACRRLLGDSLDAARLGPEALDVLAPLVARSACWSIEYAEVRDAAGAVARSTATNGCGFELLHLGDEFGHCWRVATFDDGAVLLDWPSRAVIELADDELDAIGDLVDGIAGGAERRLDRLAGLGIHQPDPVDGTTGHRWSFEGYDPIDSDVGDVVAAFSALATALVPTMGPAAAADRPTTEFVVPPSAARDVQRTAARLGFVVAEQRGGSTRLRRDGHPTDIVVHTRAGARQCGLNLDLEAMVRRARTDRIHGIDAPVLLPADAFLLSCVIAGTAIRPGTRQLARVARTAPRTRRAAWAALRRDGDRFSAVVDRACRLARRDGHEVLDALVRSRVPARHRARLAVSVAVESLRPLGVHRFEVVEDVVGKVAGVKLEVAAHDLTRGGDEDRRMTGGSEGA